MSADEIAFLKDHVQRLSYELQRYRQEDTEYRDKSEEPFPGAETPAPWLTEQKVLSPLIQEYDIQIKSLQQLLDQYMNESKTLKAEIGGLVQENDRLTGQLKEVLESELPSITQEDINTLEGDEEILQNLQLQVDSVLREKEAAVERWQESQIEIDRLQQQVQEEKNSHQWGVVEQQAQQVTLCDNKQKTQVNKKMQTEYFETVNLLNREVESSQQDLRQVKQELETATHQVKDLRKSNKELEAQLNWKDQEVADVIFKEGVADSKMSELKRIMDDRKRQITNLETENEEVKREKHGLEARVRELQQRSTDVGNREMEAVSQMREAVQMVETASLEKEQTEVAIHQKEEEVEQLREVINKLINEAGARTRQEVDSVRSQCNDRIKRLTEEVHALEMDNSEKADALEKAIREKRSAETELEKMYKEGVSEMTREKDSYEIMNKRAINAERSRDDANMMAETLQHKLRKEETNGQALKEQLESQLNNTRERFSSLQQEFENVNEDRVRLSDEIDEMKKKLQHAQQEKEAAQRKYTKEISIFENDYSMKLREYQVKLQSTDDIHRHTSTELKKLLNGQQRMCARWKEECTTIAQKYEIKVSDLRGEMTHLKSRNKEVTKLLKDSQDKTLQAEKMIQDYTRGIQRMEARMRDSESRAADASKQLSRHIIREKQMESKQRFLSDELRSSQLHELKRSQQGQTSHLETSTRSHPEDLHIGDLASSLNARHAGEIDNFLEAR